MAELTRLGKRKGPAPQAPAGREGQMNQVQLIGRLSADPELWRLRDGKEIAKLRLAVPRRDRDAEALFVDVVCFDSLAATCGAYLEKGRQVAVSGRLEHSVWKTDEGQRRERHEVIAGSVDFFARARSGEAAISNGDQPIEAAA